MAEALISGELITWARERADLSIPGLATSMRIPADKISRWETGESNPTLHQAQKLARKLSIPFGYLFLSEPPQLKPQIADLRTVGSEQKDRFSIEFEEVLNDCLRKQNWYRDQLLKEGFEPLDFVGKYSLEDRPEVVAKDIRDILHLDNSFRRSCSNWEEFLVRFIEKVEDTGMLVLRNGVVKNNNRKKLSVKEFRGFVLTDPIAPLIFINNNDAQAAKIFTLAHELAHLWIGVSGVTNSNPGRQSRLQANRIERFCNKVAAELLVPKTAFLDQWDERLAMKDNLDRLTREFRVSPLVILIRAKTCGKIDHEVFYEEYAKIVTQWKGRKGGGGNSMNTFPVRNSKLFTRTLLASTLEGGTLLREAARLLNVNVSTLHSMAHKMEIR